MRTIKVSQSLIKDWIDFTNNEMCGSEFEAKHVTHKWDRTWGDSEAKALGRYFEYILTGAMPTGYQEYPKAKYLSTVVAKMEAKKKVGSVYIPKVSDMLSDYRRAHTVADKILLLFKKSGIVIQAAQVYREKGIMTGNIDVEATLDGEEINIDIKYSGLLYDKWSKFGWMWTPYQMDYNAIQAKQYNLLNGRPVYFLVVSATNTTDVEFFKCEITDFDLEQHELLAKSMPEKIAMVNEVGWRNFPKLSKCTMCPINKTCKDARTKLIPETIIIRDN